MLTQPLVSIILLMYSTHSRCKQLTRNDITTDREDEAVINSANNKSHKKEDSLARRPPPKTTSLPSQPRRKARARESGVQANVILVSLHKHEKYEILINKLT